MVTPSTYRPPPPDVPRVAKIAIAYRFFESGYALHRQNGILYFVDDTKRVPVDPTVAQHFESRQPHLIQDDDRRR